MCRKTLTLRTFRIEDQQRVLDMLTDTAVNQTYMLPDFEKKEDALPLFHRLRALSLDGSHFVRCIALNDKAIGFLNDVEIRDGSIELGYVIHPDSQGQGHMTNALKTAISELFESGYSMVICGAFEHNTASMRVMEKSGMCRIEKQDQIEYRGKTHNCVYYMKRNG